MQDGDRGWAISLLDPFMVLPALDQSLGLEGWLARHTLPNLFAPWLILYTGTMHAVALLYYMIIKPLGPNWYFVKKGTYLAALLLSYTLASTFKDLVGFRRNTTDAAVHFMSDCMMILAVHRWAEILFGTNPKACCTVPKTRSVDA